MNPSKPPAKLTDLRTFIAELEAAGDLVRIQAPVDADQEVTVIQHKVMANDGGPALLFENIKGSPYRLVCNLFGTLERVERIFGGDPARVGPLREAGGDGFLVVCGATAALAASVAAGAHGGITASSNYAFAQAREVIDRAAAGDSETGQEALAALAGAVERHGVPGVKAAAALTGREAGLPRAPLQPPGPAALAEIEAALRAAGLI